ncbi:MAG TPA: VOC family protein [Stellaceae bacterium]|nr:VOC family protein [Stellaceae bacterium]
MPQTEQAPRLSHVGLYVTDVPKMIDFYTNVLGFVVSDGAPDGRITFLSRNPSDHHQVVLVRGRETELETPMVQQVSFNVGTLAAVQRAYKKIVASGCDGIRPTSHGNAWSVYFRDPEGNQIEMFCDTPWYVPQPCGFKIDLDASEAEVYRATEEYCRAQPGFQPMEEWRAAISQKIAAKLAAAN